MMRAITDRTRLIVCSHVTSSTATTPGNAFLIPLASRTAISRVPYVDGARGTDGRTT
jgi:hypothetical protein